MMPLQPWSQLPSQWINARGLIDLRWNKGEGANNIAALMALAAIAHCVEPEHGIAHRTYDQLCMATGLSRAKLAAGLDILEQKALIERRHGGRSGYRLENYGSDGWAKLPAKGLYNNDGCIVAFQHFHLRLPAELDAMKLYFLFAARRDRNQNRANISYDKITEYSGVKRNNIKRAVSLLAAHNLVHVEHTARNVGEEGVSTAYRLAHLDSYNHMGTKGRSTDDFVAMDIEPAPV